MSTYRILGLECSDGERCECCGAVCPKRRIVLSNGESEVRYGSQCAAMALLGRKVKASEEKVLVGQAQAADYARKWLAAGRKPQDIANAIRVRFPVDAGVVWIGKEIDPKAVYVQGCGEVR